MAHRILRGAQSLTQLTALALVCVTGCSDTSSNGDSPVSGGTAGTGAQAASGGLSSGGTSPGTGSTGSGGGGTSSGGTSSGGTGSGGLSGGAPPVGGAGGEAPACPGDPALAYQAAPSPVPGTVEAEDFDPTGYSDTTPGNEGGAYRTDVDVDIKALGAGYAIGWMTAGEWLEYTVEVAVAGDYEIELRAGAVDAGRTLELSTCGVALHAPLAVPQIGAWGQVATVTSGPIHLGAGVQVIRVTVGAADFVDFDSMSIVPYSGAGTGGSGGTGGVATGGTGGVATGGVATGGVATGGAATGGAATGGTPATCPATYSNPVIWEDLPDLEIIRVGETYYYTASTFHHSPGAPVLRSFDLVHWEYIGHSVPQLDFHARYDLNGGRSYVNGIWASSLRYRESNDTYYWIGCMHNVGGAYVFTAPSPTGPWTKHASQGCYYDVGLLIDDDDKMYVAYGNGTISVAELSADGFSQVRSQAVFTTPSDLSGPLEGSRFYKINGDYYIFTTQYANGEYVLRSTTGPFGPYEMRPFAVRVPFSVPGAGASPHQGGIIETQNGDYYYMGFNDAYPAGRIPVLAPMTWNNGWPTLTLVNGQWGASYPFPNLPCGAQLAPPPVRVDAFTGSALGPEWEWNHNPDNSRWSIGGGLTLQTATVTTDLYSARNTLTRRMVGPTSTATIELDYSGMQNGDAAGLAAFRDSTAWIGVKRANGTYRVVVVDGITLDSSWNTSSIGSEAASASVSGGRIWLRIEADIRTSAGGGTARFFYSTDGSQFTPLGTTFTMKKDWTYFLGYRYGIFNYATAALGGSVNVARFELETP